MEHGRQVKLEGGGLPYWGGPFWVQEASPPGGRPISHPTRSAPMRQPRSIRFHLSLVFIFFFLLIFFLGMLSIARLRDFNNVSPDIADLWLPNTPVLGDLNNYTSAFPAAEASTLLSSD